MSQPGKNIEQLTELFLTEGLTSREEIELQQLLKEPENRVYFKKMYVIWSTMHDVPGKEEVEQALQKILFRVNRQDHRYNMQGKQGWISSFGKIAAAICISFVLGALSYYFIGKQGPVVSILSDSGETTKVIVPLGSRSQVELPDGSVVTLNAGSELYYLTTYGRDNREVELNGEGYFKVEENADIPFIVKTRNIAIKALGTEFNVKAYSDEEMVQTTLVTGSISIRREEGEDQKEWLLKPNQTVTIYKYFDTITEQNSNNSNIKRAKKQSADINPIEPKPVITLEQDVETVLYTSWKDTRWVIESETIENLAIKLQRRYDVQIIITDEALKKYPFTGILADETLEQVLEIMKSVVPINYHVNKKIVLLSINPLQRKIFEQSMSK